MERSKLRTAVLLGADKLKIKKLHTLGSTLLLRSDETILYYFMRGQSRVVNMTRLGHVPY